MNASGIGKLLSKNRGVIALCAAIILNSTGQGSTIPALPFFAQGFGAAATLVVLTVVMFPMGRLIMSLPGGLLTQRLGRKPVLVASMVVTALGALLMAFSQDISQLIGFRLLSGLGGGTFVMASTVYLRDVATVRTRARYQSLNELSILFGVSVGAILGGFMAEVVGLRAPLFFHAATAAIAVPILIAFVKETKGSKEDPEVVPGSSSQVPEDKWKALRGLFFDRGFLLMALLSLWIVATRQGGRFSLMPLLGEEKGFNPGDLGMFFFFTHVPQFFAVLAAGLLADRFGRKMPIVPAAVFMTLGIAVFVVTDSYWLLLVSGVLLGSGEGLAGPPTVTYFADRAPRGMEGVVMGLYGTFSGAGALGGALILGSLADAYSFEVALWVDAFVFLGLGLAVMALVRESARRISRSGPG